MKNTALQLRKFITAASLCVVATMSLNAQEKPPGTVIDRDALAARGSILTNQDPTALELRIAYGNGEAGENGFNIGMAIAEGHTSAGPGKDRICASLRSGEPGGCNIAVLFSVDRNRNSVLIAKGVAIASADPAFARARNTNPFVRLRLPTELILYRLGFDIGLGASEGHTSPGPGKDKIRDLLNLRLQGGFNAAVSFAIERNRSNAGLGLTTEATEGPAQAAASREIRCRGYSRRGGMEYVFFTIGSRPGTTGETLVTYEIAFAPGTRAAGPKGEGLQPGNCAWVDRPIDQNGPYRIRFETVDNAQLRVTLHGSTVDRSITAAESYPDVNTIPAYLKGENHYWSFGGVTDSGRGHFVATGNGYWKPAVAVGEVQRSPTEQARPRRARYPPKP